jgi:two-component system LytT family response regulator
MTQEEKQITSVIVDDEKLSRDIIVLYLKKHFNIKIVAQCSNGLDALNEITILKPDLIFLDIQMPDISGFEILSKLSNENRPIIIFITAYDNFALKAFEVNAIDYLLKPFELQRFITAVEKAIKQINSKQTTHLNKKIAHLLADYDDWKNQKTQPLKYITRILIKDAKKSFFIKTKEVSVFESSGDYVLVHHGTTKNLLNESLSNLEEKLNPSEFIRIHRSTIINIDFIQEMIPHFNGEYQILLTTGAKLKLSRTYKVNLKNIIERH